MSGLTQSFRRLRSVGAVALAGVAMAVAFNAAAHVPEGSPLMKYKGFILNMTKADGEAICCHMKDGQGNVKEEIVRDDQGTQRYVITVTEDQSGNKLKAPKKIIIPNEALVSGKHAKEVCDTLKREDPTNPDARTCNAPPTNIVWTGDYDDRTDPEDIQIYCYYPKPKMN